MVRRRRAAAGHGGSRSVGPVQASPATRASNVYRELLDEAGVGAQGFDAPEPPLKRRRHAEDGGSRTARPTRAAASEDERESQDDADVEFEDVVLPPPTVQTVRRDSDEDDDEAGEPGDDAEFEDVDISALIHQHEAAPEPPRELELNLSSRHDANSWSKKTTNRRKPMTREEKERRVEVHKVHLLCLLAHVARRNQWCNDGVVQESLRPHLAEKTARFLDPKPHLSQFGMAESLKTGLQQAGAMWKNKFAVTERGLRRALWATSVDQLKDSKPPDGMDSCLDRTDFREAAKSLQGSRDVGAQLYCALLRSVGVRARLVCSLQPLAFSPGAPMRTKAREKQAQAPGREQDISFVERYKKMADSASDAGSSTARRRLGHPNAASHHFTSRGSPPRPAPCFDVPKIITESAYPVYWVEVLDVGHQKWQPADPLVTQTFWKPRTLEPPITDEENYMCYVVAFEADGTAKDVTRRYAKAYTAKTRRLRVDGAVDGGDVWWRKALNPFRRVLADDLDRIEDVELLGAETREPMPRNVQDFKDHPIYALERHLRRHEALRPDAKPSGTVSAGSRGPLEKIYRRRDVQTARTRDKWYRLGRVVKPLEIPIKWLPKKKASSKRASPAEARGQEGPEGEETDGGLAGDPLYTMEQTELYVAPAVRNGRVPKNKFGNIEVYAASMVPRGGVHIAHEQARRAAFLLGVDYAPALTGFTFQGRQGTAVLNGVVVAREAEEAMRAVMAGLEDGEREAEEARRGAVALRTWRRLLMGLRIRERIWGRASEQERRAEERRAEEAQAGLGLEGAESDVTEEFDVVGKGDERQQEAGGFVVE